MVYLFLGSVVGYLWLISIPVSVILFATALLGFSEWVLFFYSILTGLISKLLLRGFRDAFERVKLEKWLVERKGFSLIEAADLWRTTFGDGGAEGHKRVIAVYVMTDEQLSIFRNRD